MITNAGSAHLEGLRDVTGVARAKAEILNGLDRSGAVVINADDRFAAYWLARARHFRSVTFGLESEADIRGDATTVGDKLLIEVSLPDGRLEFSIESARSTQCTQRVGGGGRSMVCWLQH